MPSRRNFLKGVGASATMVISAPGVAEIDVAAHATEHRHKFVTHEHFVTKGDGTNEGDLAMLKVDGRYQNHVLTNGKWRKMFAD